MDKYNEYRLKYKNFYYYGFDIKYYEDYIFVTYDFEIEDLMSFNPTLKVPINKDINYDKELVEKIVFYAGLAEIPSYWKPTCCPNLIIECGFLDDRQISWLKKLIFNGLGEFFYVNSINPSYDDFVSITSNGKTYDVIDNNSYGGYLVAVGGGKDSITSLEILKDKTNKKAFIINNRKVCFDSCYTAGLTNKDILNVERIFDRKIIELNNKGFLNGHTPISSCIAFISFLTAYLNGIKYVVLSNESSANEATVKGTNINHQYSKSLEFENDFRWFTKEYITDKIEYFSLLRPLSELEIMKIFTKYPKYFNKFISCNKGGTSKNIGKTDGWCCTCSKCLFIYLLMSNFVEKDKMIEIFGEDLLDKKEMLNFFLELLGKKETKPFECVGTIEEVTYVVNNLISKNDNLPYLLKYYKDNFEVIEPNNSLITNINNEHNVKDDLLELIRKELNND